MAPHHPIQLSIVIATFNRGEGLIRTLRSLTNQTLDFARFEVIAVNNNCTDQTSELFEAFVAEGTGLQARMVVETQQGLSPARNRGIAESRGPYIAIIDDDEEVNVDFATSYVEFFDSHPSVAAAGGVITPHYETTPPRWLTPYAERPIAGTLHLGNTIRPFPSKLYPGGGNTAIRKSAIEQHGAFNPELGRTGTKLLGGEEKDLFNRLRQAGEQIYYVPGAEIFHHIPPEKLTADYFNRVTRMGGQSERIRTQSEGRGSYPKRLATELIKWGGTIVLFLGYTLRGTPIKGWYLLKMRGNITRGLLGF